MPSSSPMPDHRPCASCRHAMPAEARFCPACGERVREVVREAGEGKRGEADRSKEILNLQVLYGMVGALIVALVFPPWETPPGTAPVYLGMHFLLDPPEPGAVVSRVVQTVELVTLAIAGLYLAWVFREKP